MQNTIKTQSKKEPIIQLSCTSCGHMTVCSVIRDLQRNFAENFTEKTLPFEAYELAKICKKFVDNVAIETLRDNQ